MSPMSLRTLLAGLAALVVFSAVQTTSAQVVRWGRPEHSILPGLGRTNTLFAEDTFSAGDLARMRLKGRVTETHAYLEVPKEGTSKLDWDRVGAIATMRFDKDGHLSSVILDEPRSDSAARLTITNEFNGEGSDRRIVKRTTHARYTENPTGYTEITHLTYDAQGRMTGVKSGSEGETSSELILERDPAGNPATIISKDAGGSSATERFNLEGKLVALETTSKEKPQPTRYRIDWSGPRAFKGIRLNDTGEEEILNATLDEHGSLVSWSTTLDGMPRTFTRDIVYDSTGNWTRITMYEIKAGTERPVAIERWNRNIDYTR